eukprot:CAMPEP_0202079652 /NCGR_PEP_ID=MMETSP0964-20121228/6605_1 /ASSEMBLY_ACC=CAM_ASM_000500 /TAXON_ID=4773 /ORGANISM="Schizochytrium aggregatum, Strain ATCC28209" /LENGTH=90 /DNA_ID=CAMNT_0048646999 /DNA_START=460 /DNA_END=732 /DNA_ORIENTATION=+
MPATMHSAEAARKYESRSLAGATRPAKPAIVASTNITKSMTNIAATGTVSVSHDSKRCTRCCAGPFKALSGARVAATSNVAHRDPTTPKV